MQRFLGRLSPILYSLLRIVAGALFASHGAQKILGAFGGFGGEPGATAPAGSIYGVAGWIELVGGLLIMIGLCTTVAAFVASGEMAFAYFGVHAPRALVPLLNQGELSALYAWLFLYMASRGGGMWSLDALLGRVRRRGEPSSP